MKITTEQANGLIELVQRETDKRIREMYEDFMPSDWFFEAVGANHQKHAAIMGLPEPKNRKAIGFNQWREATGN